MKITHNRKLNRIPLIIFAVLTAMPLFSQPHHEQPPVVLDEGWLYRWGDPPIGEEGVPLWLQDDHLWTGLSPGGFLQPNPGQNIVWYKIKLPDKQWRNPAIFIPPVVLHCEVYLDSARIYKQPAVAGSVRNRFSGITSHFIPLPEKYRNRILAIRIFSDAKDIGINAAPHPFMIGREGDVYARLVHTNIENIIIGFVLIFTGLFAVFIFLRRFHRKNYLLFTFGFFSLCAGLFYVSFGYSGHLFVESPELRYYIRIFSYLFFPIGLYAFVEKLVGKNLIIRRIWQLHLTYAVVALTLDFLGITAMPEYERYYSVFFAATILTILFISIREAVAGHKEFRIFITALAFYGLTGLHDILIGVEVIPPWYMLSQWGALIFVLTLGYIVERRFALAHRKLEHYSRELEIKSRKLDKYSQVLEQKVAERTQDLNQKNRELENTLRQLREMQHQLIMQEKMASLGNLVAGVAHEVNNPIGAVKSSAHVVTRCIDKIHQTLSNSKTIDDIRNDEQFQKALEMLRENNQVIGTASNRVAEIVVSLKNFARLDEAELQQVDIHEGIDTTLTLVEHQLKNRIEVIKKYGKIPKINCYPNQLNQVFMNLFVNAAHAIADKGTIRIKTCAKDGRVEIQISDNGRGIPRQHLEKIFDPGFTTKGRGIGAGLGLSISYKIIEKHNGEIRVESEEGWGTTFTITLPVNQ